MRRQLWLFVLVVWSAVVGCKREAATTENYYVAEAVHLAIPKLPGWVVDTTVPAPDAAKGGIVLRLVRESAIAGSPRMDVVVEPAPSTPTAIEDFLTRNLQEMGQLEASGRIHIDAVDQRRLMLGSRPAYRVHHEYTVGSGSAQVAINQVSTFVVVDGRGVAVTAAGRTELYHPLADSVQAMIEGLKFTDDTRGPAAGPAPSNGPQPVDLGKVGGPKHK